jgi:hypothetical protein
VFKKRRLGRNFAQGNEKSDFLVVAVPPKIDSTPPFKEA